MYSETQTEFQNIVEDIKDNNNLGLIMQLLKRLSGNETFFSDLCHDQIKSQ